MKGDSRSARRSERPSPLIDQTHSSQENGAQAEKRYFSPETRAKLSAAAKARWARQREVRPGWEAIDALYKLAVIRLTLQGEELSADERRELFYEAIDKVVALMGGSHE
jgi:hypothetical protein